MQDQIEALYALQQTDTLLARAQAELDGLDHGVPLRREAKAAKAKFDEVEAQYRAKKTDQKDAELELSKVEEKIDKNEKAVYGGKITNPKEVSNIQKETRSLKKRQGELDERVLTLMSEVEELEAGLEAAKKEAQGLAKQYRATVAEHEKRQAELEGTLKSLDAQRQERAAAVAPEHVGTYERHRPGMGNLVVVPLDGSRCTGCRMQLPSLVVKAAEKMERLTKCDGCGRILYCGTGSREDVDEDED